MNNLTNMNTSAAEYAKNELKRMRLEREITDEVDSWYSPDSKVNYTYRTGINGVSEKVYNTNN